MFLFQSPLSEEWLRIFHKNGYQGTTQLNKKLVYHTALVLGGGGAHGAYQIGVWQALKEHDINFEIITGTSVGALNGALILQGDMKKAVNLWKSCRQDKCLRYQKWLQLKTFVNASIEKDAK